ncbi:hypothetical protein [Prosthecobacter sp.]|uniref:hypothetical protein n=1 Tax=Prosthecobacter sp. TaxID=1965333 RepID=UPI003785081C
MNPTEHLDALLARSEPLLALAPMQDVTDLEFWRLMARYGGADVYYETLAWTADSHLRQTDPRLADSQSHGQTRHRADDRE